MNKIFSFLAGAMSGALVGAVTALLLTPASGQDLRADVAARISAAKEEFEKAYDENVSGERGGIPANEGGVIQSAIPYAASFPLTPRLSPLILLPASNSPRPR
jgi:gas vesicle protein